MELHSLKPAKGAVKKEKRIGRGQGSTRGGTSTRGHKGQKSRSGFSRKRNHEGGQMPMQMRLPKRGFKNHNRVEYVGINLKRLQDLADKHNVTTLDLETMISLGLVRRSDKVKILGNGELKSRLTVTAHAYSESAKSGIEAKGGNINLV
jgi:large subunit ribosomal protein L15